MGLAHMGPDLACGIDSLQSRTSSPRSEHALLRDIHNLPGASMCGPGAVLGDPQGAYGALAGHCGVLRCCVGTLEMSLEGLERSLGIVGDIWESPRELAASSRALGDVHTRVHVHV